MKNSVKTIKILLVSLVLLFSGCATVDRGNFGQFVKVKNIRSYGYTVIDTKKENIDIPKPPVSIIERFEVRDGDCYHDSALYSTNDCTRDRERSEMEEISGRDYEGSEKWYTWSIYFPKDYKSIEPAQADHGQFYQGKKGALYMFVIHNGYRIKRGLDTNDRFIISKPIIDEKDLRGKWHTIKVHAKWSSDSKVGFFKVWVDNKLKFEDRRKTYYGETAFKYGIYRAYIQKYQNKLKWDLVKDLPADSPDSAYKISEDKLKVPTQVIYYSNVRRANTEEGLFPKEIVNGKK